MIGDLGIQMNGKKFYINANSTAAQLDGMDVSMTHEWKVQFGNVALVNRVKGRMYEISVISEDIEITFIRKVYMMSDLPGIFTWHAKY